MRVLDVNERPDVTKAVGELLVSMATPAESGEARTEKLLEVAISAVVTAFNATSACAEVLNEDADALFGLVLDAAQTVALAHRQRREARDAAEARH